MEFLLGEALTLASFVVVAYLYARPAPLWFTLLAAAPWLLVGQLLVARSGELGRATDRPVLFAVYALAHAAVFVVAYRTASVLRSVRGTADGLRMAPLPVDVPMSELFGLRHLAMEAAFTPVPEGVVWFGDAQVAVLVHPDGTRAEIIQRDGWPPGFAFATELADADPVVSVPWSHGIDDSRIRVPGASFTDLLAHHRAGVAEAVAAGAEVRPVESADALSLVLESDRSESERTLHRPWANAFVMALQQSPLRVVLRR